MTSESSLGSYSERSLDSSSPSAGPSRKKCRFRDSYSLEVRGEGHMEIDMGVEVTTSDIREDDEELEAEASTGGMMEITVDPLVTSGIFKPTGGDVPDLEGTLYDISHYMYEVPL
ncbi:hypothetical protein Tco_1573647, partial [Tanacetum coccineum]